MKLSYKITWFVSLALAFVAGYFLSIEFVSNSPDTSDSSEDQCGQEAVSFFAEMNGLNMNLDYSFANNDSSLENLLGKDYNHITKKDNNCYALVKNYINEYRYSILNIDTKNLEVVLIEHELTNDSLRNSFIESYSEVFKK
ncbi:hypothetical protein H6783_03385 [Candidatus Nomurabacteria bacterium]|nr:hypothetical protein [Candidatus Nomurabacteria bacterium]